MMFNKIQAIVLAAGKSSRFKTNTSKLAEKICGQEMILYTTKLLESLHIPTTVVVGHQAELIKTIITSNHPNSHYPVTFVHQHEQNGTGHALICTREHWTSDTLLVINGDMPLISADIITDLYKQHSANNAAISFVTSHLEDPSIGSYGRVIKTTEPSPTHNSVSQEVNPREIISIVEAKEFTGDPHQPCFINAGIYLIDRSFLEHYNTALEKSPIAQEFYITDLVKIASDANLPVVTTRVPFDHVRGINTLQELWTAEQIKKADIIKHWMDNGVRFSVIYNIQIDINVTIGTGSVIGSGTYLRSGTRIGKNCTIGEFSSITNSVLEDNVTLLSHCVISDSFIGSHASVGPFAHVRLQSKIMPRATIGNFVEVKNSTVGQESKAKHLSYLGDATIGNRVNIGAGTITCNHDSINKHQTIIKDNVYVGSNSTLIAPITIEHEAFIAAGSVITESVPQNAFAIGRSYQTTKENYATILRERIKNSSHNNNYTYLPTGDQTGDYSFNTCAHNQEQIKILNNKNTLENSPENNSDLFTGATKIVILPTSKKS